jgi:hypothetical protein
VVKGNSNLTDTKETMNKTNDLHAVNKSKFKNNNNVSKKNTKIIDFIDVSTQQNSQTANQNILNDAMQIMNKNLRTTKGKDNNKGLEMKDVKNTDIKMGHDEHQN